MAEPIYFVGGSKGGVGKSAVSAALLDYLGVNGQKPILIDADTANPDVFKAYRSDMGPDALTLDLDHSDGWIDMLTKLHENPDAAFVINTPARNNEGVRTYGQMLSETLGTLARRMVTFWVINRQRDSVELLRDFLEAMSSTEIVVLRNLHHGSEAKFELYGKSETCRIVENGRRGKSRNFPEMADRVADDLNSKRLSIARGIETLPFGNKVELERFRRECNKLFAEVVHE